MHKWHMCWTVFWEWRRGGRLHCMFAFLIASHRNPGIDCCKGPSIFKWDSALSDVCAKYREVNDFCMAVCDHNLPFHVELCISLSAHIMYMQVHLFGFFKRNMRWNSWQKGTLPNPFFDTGSLIEKHWSGQGKQCAYLHIKIAKGYWQSVCSHWMKSHEFLP